jgi:RNA methyltransferase, TrmH family
MKRGSAHGGPVLDSPRNPLARTIRDLERDRALRDRSGLSIAWGLHLAGEALIAGVELHQALVGPLLERSPEGADILRRLRAARTPIARGTTRLLESVVPGSGDQGVILLVRRRVARDPDAFLEGGPTLVLAARGVQDPGNLGSILRSARAFGVDAALALEGCADPFGSRAVRAAMGATFTLPIACARTIEAMAACERSGLTLVAADPQGDLKPSDFDFRRPTAILLGGEGAGLPASILAGAASRLRIAIARGVDSLNVHAAAVVLLYEASRQRGFAGLTPGSGPGRSAAGPPKASPRVPEAG